MSTKKHKSIIESALSNISKEFRKKLVDSYLELKRRNSETQYDAAGISAGKFCEVVIRLLQKEITGSYTPFGQQIQNMSDECRKAISSPKNTAIESLRIIIPRALIYLYTLRNKRGIGHVGGDVDANKIDLLAIVTTADWIVCELIRIYHGISLEEAQDLVDGISFRNVPHIWEVSGKKRILIRGLTTHDQVLLLLYSEPESAILVEDLYSWVEYSNLSIFKSKVLLTLHKKRFIEYDRESQVVHLSPTGAKHVEEKIPRNI